MLQEKETGSSQPLPESTEKKDSSFKQSCMTLSFSETIAILNFDDVDAKVNTLNSKLIPQFEKVLTKLESSPQVRALVLRSGKKNSFVAGADITQLQACKTAQEAEALSRSGQKIFSRLAALKMPVVAAIHGTCLGGGLELALACDYRVASTSPSTSLGLPEVMLGLLPGAGGTQRLPKLIGFEKALQMMLTGAAQKAEKAKRTGLVDYLVHPDGLDKKSLEVAHALADKTLRVERKEQKGVTGVLASFDRGKKFMLQKALQQVGKKTRGLYPAPKGIIEVLNHSIDHPGSGYQKEAEVFGRLSQTRESKGLISLYFGQTDLTKNRYGDVDHPVKKLGVLGAGLMGAGISMISLQKSFDVRLRDLGQKQLASGKKYIWDQLKGRVKRKSMTQFDADKTLSRLYTQTDFRHFSDCQLVIEAVFEDLDLKHKVLKELEEHASAEMIFASNTSALPIADIAKASKRPERVIGMHYFSPVHKMPLLEIIVTDQTSDEVAKAAVDVGIRQGKTVIVVGDGPGFYTTRILAPFMDEVSILALEGLDFHKLDTAMKDFGYPVGPIALIDEVGIDVAYHVGKNLGSSLGERVSSGDTQILTELIAKGAKGRKSGKGFYLYPKEDRSLAGKLVGLGKKSGRKEVNPDVLTIIRRMGEKTSSKVSVDDIQKRMYLRMVNEAAYCLHEGVLRRPLDGDIGAVFGLGFPPFLGGPFRLVDEVGAASIVSELRRFEEKFGARFTPAPNLIQMAENGEKFYPA